MKVGSSILVLGAACASIAEANAGAGQGTKPLVTPEKLQALIKVEDLLAGSQQLEDFAYAYPARNRVFGGPAHLDTVNWLYRELKRTGYYNVYKQPQVHLWSKSEQSLVIDGEDQDPLGMTYGPSGNATAELVVIPNLGCAAADFPADVAGKLAVISRGTCTFSDKSALAGAAKAAGAVIYNNVDGTLSGTLGSPTNPLGPYVPTVGISKAAGDALVAKLAGASITGALSVNAQSENRTTYNVIAETKKGDHNNVVSLGGHTDSVEAGPGINDDGSGIIGNLAVAKALTQFSVKNAVRFAFWTAEEFGLLGSEYYVASLNVTELNKIRLYLNFDMIASPNYVNMVYDGDGSSFNVTGPAGSAEIEALFQEYYESNDLPYGATAFDGRSDYGPFLDVGIPSGGLFTGAEKIKTEEEAALFGGTAGVAYDANYHAAGDNVTNLALDAFEINAKATAYAVAKYAVNLDSIPPRNSTTLTKRGHKHKRNDPHLHATGCMHVIKYEL